MGRIPDTELERLKSDVSIQRLAEARGVILRKRGEELMGLCPFHDDHSPSLVINPIKNVWNCLGACQAGGSVIDWVMKAEGVSFRHAVELLRNDFSPLAADSGASGVVKQTTTTKLGGVVEASSDHQAQLHQVIDYYHETLKSSPEALAYLEKRGIGDSEAIEQFKLGYCNRTLGYRIPFKNRASGSAIRIGLQAVGIIRSSGHEHFRGSLVIPVIDDSGEVTEVYGRKIGTAFRKDTPLHLYLPGPHRGVWNVAGFKDGNEVILCESLIDALTFWCVGYRHVTASYGTGGFTGDHLAAFKSAGIDRVYIAYDADEAGDRAAMELSAHLEKENIGCYRVVFPKGLDVNEYALKVTPANKSLGLVLANAQPMNAVKDEREEVTPSEPPDLTVLPVVEPEPSMEKEDALPLVAENSPAPTPALAPDSAPSPDVDTQIEDNEIIIRFGDRRWRIRGLEKNLSYEVLRVNLLVSKDDVFHVDTFDLYAARHRQMFLKQAASELQMKEEILKKDLGKVLLKLETLQEQQINQTLTPKKTETPALSESEQNAAMSLLMDPCLMDRILIDFEQCGIVGEETNKLVGYLAAVSRKLEEPLAVVIQSSSAAGKSSLMEGILAFLPGEEQVKYSAMTGQSLFYMGETDLQHKILAIVEEEGAEKASYALKLLQSEGELTIASTGKDPATGRLVTQEYRVEGPVMIFLTTTAIEIDEELLNRCIVLTVDEDREQTRAIHRLQRERQTLPGLLARQDRGKVISLHQNAQRLLRPLLVANPFATKLTFIDDQTRTRRDHMKYLTLIRSIALLRQYQRPMKQILHDGKPVSYIEVTVDDIEIANRLCHQVLGRSLDELAPQTRRLLMSLDKMVRERCEEKQIEREDFRFTRRDVREYSGFGMTQTRIHLDRLMELEYVIPHHGGRGYQFLYELLYDGGGKNEPHLSGLIDVDALQNSSTISTWRGQRGEMAERWRGHDGPKTVGWRGVDRQVSVKDFSDIRPLNGKTPKIAYVDRKKSPFVIPSLSHTDTHPDSLKTTEPM